MVTRLGLVVVVAALMGSVLYGSGPARGAQHIGQRVVHKVSAPNIECKVKRPFLLASGKFVEGPFYMDCLHDDGYGVAFREYDRVPTVFGERPASYGCVTCLAPIRSLGRGRWWLFQRRFGCHARQRSNLLEQSWPRFSNAYRLADPTLF